MRTSGEIDFRFRLKLKITLVESTYPSQRPECPSLSPHFLLELIKKAWNCFQYNNHLEKIPRQFSVVLLFYIIISSWRPKPQLRDQTGSFPTRRGTCVRSIKINYCGAECWRLKRCQLRMANCWLKNTDRVQMFSILSSHPHSVFLFCYLILVWFLRITIRKVSNYRAKYPESSLFMLHKNRNFPKIQTLIF